MTEDTERLMISLIKILADRLPGPIVVSREELAEAAGHVVLAEHGIDHFELVVLPDYVSIGVEPKQPVETKLGKITSNNTWKINYDHRYNTNTTTTFGPTTTATRIDTRSRSP